MDHQQRITYLFEKYYGGSASKEEISELEALLSGVDEGAISGLMRKAWQEKADSSPFFAQDHSSKILRDILGAVPGSTPVIPVRRRVVFAHFRVAAAAAVVITLALGAVWLARGKRERVAPTLSVSVKKAIDLEPGSNKAILTLADGSRVVLDSASTGAITRQGNVTVIKLDDGQLSYKPSNAAPASVVAYNTVTTPRGGQYQLVLSDGTKVWLNAASSLKFPTAFTGDERRVTLSGEGYFEVAHNKEKPFYVNAGDMNVKVLGTHFDIKAYEEENEFQATLLQGSVRVISGEQTLLLRPGQQAQFQTGSHQLRTVNGADLEAVVAWKNGRFSCHDQELPTIMRQMARWYDVDVIYKDQINDKYTVNVPHNVPASQLFKFIEMSGGVHFEIAAGKVIVSK